MFNTPAGAAQAVAVAGAAVALTDDDEDSIDRLVYTFPNMQFGVAVEGRHIIIGVSGRNGGSISSLTVAGQPATFLISALETVRASLYIVDLSKSIADVTEGTVVVNWSLTSQRCAIGVWRATGIASATPDDTKNDTTATARVNSLALNIPDGGLAVSYQATAGSAGSVSVVWAGLTEVLDKQHVEAATTGYTGASDDNMALEVGRTITVTIDNSVTVANAVMVAGSWAAA